MGLAASQARLLFITARKSDVEFSEMKIAAAKMRLSSESQEIADEYNRSLNMRKLVYVADGSATSSDAVNLSYDLLMSPNATNTTSQYMLTDVSNRVVLSDGYISKLGLSGDSGNLGSMDRASFLGKFGLDASLYEDAYVAPAANTPAPTATVAPTTILENMNSIQECLDDPTFSAKDSDTVTKPVYLKFKASFDDLAKNLQAELASSTDVVKKADIQTMLKDVKVAQETLETAYTSTEDEKRMGCIAVLKTILIGVKCSDQVGSQRSPGANRSSNDAWGAMHRTAPQILDELKGSGFKDVNSYYSGNLFDTYSTADVNTTTSPTEDTNKSAPAATDQNKADFYTNLYYAVAAKGWSRNDKITDSAYLSNQLINGGMQLQKLNSDGSWSQSAMSDPSSPIRNVKDTEGMEAAKAKYDMARDQMNDKDSEIDIEMKNLETERSALDTELDSVKAIITKNIERSFKTFA